MRNISPIPLPSAAAGLDVDREVVLPALEPVIRGVSLMEAAQIAHAQIVQQVYFGFAHFSKFAHQIGCGHIDHELAD
jgi:hypothetical protein